MKYDYFPLNTQKVVQTTGLYASPSFGSALQYGFSTSHDSQINKVVREGILDFSSLSEKNRMSNHLQISEWDKKG